MPLRRIAALATLSLALASGAPALGQAPDPHAHGQTPASPPVAPSGTGQGQGQGPMMQHQMPMPGQARQAATPGNRQAVAAYRAANARMHRDMAIAYSGNPDRDFAASMIPHHQGAIDMARVMLQYGSDPDLRRMAQEIIDAQEREIATLRAWLAAHPR